jgi:hypothetical protein
VVILVVTLKRTYHPDAPLRLPRFYIFFVLQVLETCLSISCTECRRPFYDQFVLLK